LSEGDAHGGHNTSLRDYLRVVRRRNWIILQAVLLVPAVAVGLIQQNPADQFNGNTQSAVQPADRQAQTQADLARVPQVAQRTLASRDL
jgi:uncharacterized protein involved in exopolysaccharide biosynthesis